MPKAENISTLQAILILTGCRLTTGYIYLPLPTPPANQDVWLVQIFSMVYIFIICVPLLYLSKRFPELTLVQYAEKIMGKAAGKLIGILYVAFFLLINLLVLIDVTLFLLAAIIPETPAYAVMLVALVASLYTAYKGVEVLGRTAEVFMPYIFLSIILFFILGLKDMNFEVFLPVFRDSGFQQINFGAFNFSGRFYEVIILCMLVPNLKNKKDLNKVFYVTVFLFIFILTVITISTQATLGIELSLHSNYPQFSFAKLIDLFDFIQRIESLNVIGWFIVELLKLSTYFYFASIGVKQVFNVKSNKVFFIPMAGLLFLLGLFTDFKKAVVTYKFVSFSVLPYISFIFMLIIPLILLIVYFFRRKSFSL